MSNKMEEITKAVIEACYRSKHNGEFDEEAAMKEYMGIVGSDEKEKHRIVINWAMPIVDTCVAKIMCIVAESA